MVSDSAQRELLLRIEADAKLRLERALAKEKAASLERIEAERGLAAAQLLLTQLAAEDGHSAQPREPTPPKPTLSFLAFAPPKPKPSGGPETWPEVVTTLLRECEGGLTPPDILKLLAEREWGQIWINKHRSNPNALSNTVLRLWHSGRIGRIGRRYYDPIVYERAYSGEIKVDPSADERPDSIPAAIREIISRQSGPVHASVIIEGLRQIPTIAPRLDPTNQLAYAHLSKMARIGQLVREAGHYELPERAERDEESAPQNVSHFPKRG